MPYRSQLFQWMIHTRNGMITTMFVLSVVSFLFTLGIMTSPCSISKAQTICQVGDTETFTGPVDIQDNLTLQGELNIGATPYAGQFGSVPVADDDADVSPEWWLDRKFVKIVDEDISTSTTLQDDDIFTHTFTVNPTLITDPPNQFRRYIVELLLIVSGDSTGDIDIAWTVPASWTLHGVMANDITAPTFVSITESSETTIAIDATARVYNITAVLDPETTTGTGTFTMRWAQNVSNNTSTIERGSWMRITEVRPNPS